MTTLDSLILIVSIGSSIQILLNLYPPQAWKAMVRNNYCKKNKCLCVEYQNRHYHDSVNVSRMIADEVMRNRFLNTHWNLLEGKRQTYNARYNATHRKYFGRYSAYSSF